MLAAGTTACDPAPSVPIDMSVWARTLAVGWLSVAGAVLAGTLAAGRIPVDVSPDA